MIALFSALGTAALIFGTAYVCATAWADLMCLLAGPPDDDYDAGRPW